MAGQGDSGVDESTSLGTGLVFDKLLSRHYCAWNAAYTERPERIRECYSRIQQLGLEQRCVNIPVRPATDEEVGVCHTRKHMDILKETQFMNTEQLSQLSCTYDFVYFHPAVEENARLALGGAIDLTDQVVTGKLQNGMAVIRPPGHHAMSEQFSGYCYFNNVAVAARIAMQKHALQRILILDWDVHHGQGTQFDFYDDPRVLFFSIHRYEHGLEWPHLRESDYDYTGEGAGAGFNFNVPLNETGCNNEDYLSIFFNVLLPVAYEFQPELVLVSAGYDSAIGCPEGQMSVTPACFAHFVNLLKPLAAGKLVLLMEGGYCLKTLAEGAALSLRALLGDPTPNIPPLAQPRDSVVESILNTITVQRAFHPSLAYQNSGREREDSYPWQCTTPPQLEEELRTRDKQPEAFPLIQQCADCVPPSVQAALNQHIAQLERDTVLDCTQHRLGLVQYQLDASKNGKRSSIEESLSERGLMSRCHKLSPLTSHKTSPVSLAVGAIMDNTVQSCVLLPSLGNSEDDRGGTFEGIVKSVISCLHHDFPVNRTLYINITSKHPTSLQSLLPKHDNRSLVISLGACPGLEELPSSCQPAPVHITFNQSPVCDSDIVAAVQQLLLPIAYEFGPDFVVVCLDSLKTDEMQEGPSAACLGHVMAVVQGLARGRLLVLTTRECVEERGEVVVEVVSVLQGNPCLSLSVCTPQHSTVEMIKVLQDKHKAVWKMLRFRETLPPAR